MYGTFWEFLQKFQKHFIISSWPSQIVFALPRIIILNWMLPSYQEIAPSILNIGVLGKEVGENGTPHLQGYFEFDNSMKLRISAAQNRIQLLGLEGYHLEIARGTAQQSITYCSKDGDFFEEV